MTTDLAVLAMAMERNQQNNLLIKIWRITTLTITTMIMVTAIVMVMVKMNKKI